MDSVNIDGVTVGYLYVHEAQDKPVVAIATNGSDIQEAANLLSVSGTVEHYKVSRVA